jgi:hypothetical protein
MKVRVALLVALAMSAVSAVSAVSLGLLISDASWRTAWREVSAPAPAAALSDGPVMVMGGSPTRLALALTLPGVPGPSRTLLLSGSAVDDWEARGGGCDDPHVRCAQPDPSTTYGEALMLDRLATAHGWDAVTVVTSDFHVARTRWQLAACTDLDVTVVAPGSGGAPDDQPRLERLKLINAGLRTTCR